MRKKYFAVAVLVSFGLLVIQIQSPGAQEAFPRKPITLIVGYPAGGGHDIIARSYNSEAAKILGQPVVLLHKPGANGLIALEALMNSKPDGYTILQASTTSVSAAILKKGKDKLRPEDYTVILGLASFNTGWVVRADAPWKNFQEWVEYVRKNPGFKIGDSGAAGNLHLLTGWVGRHLKLKLVPVHFQGDPDVCANVLGGHVQMGASSMAAVELIKAGKMRTLLQYGGEPADPHPELVMRASTVIPEVPKEISEVMVCLLGPKGLPNPIKETLHSAFKKASAENPDYEQSLKRGNLKPVYLGPEAMQQQIAHTSIVWEREVKALALEGLK